DGLFEFDIRLPQRYPVVAPEVHFLTTGNGSVRFNPNLYNSGKVCLSLLGTWRGPGWEPNKSTLLQVFVSIQSLILVPDPWFNEPGYEHDMGTPKGDAESESYNQTIRAGTLRFAILEPLRR
ncbi:ubiquitin-conjugating enzyme/RWD-like protein, partial [Tribonema minus]